MRCSARIGSGSPENQRRDWPCSTMTATSFITGSGVVVPAITADQMREVDRVATEEIGPNLFQMMENAGRSLAALSIEMLGRDWPNRPVVVLAGRGGNGGGGICAARHLANRGGDVTVVVSDEAGLSPLPRQQLGIFQGTRGRHGSLAGLPDLEADLIVDAIVGYSLSGELRGPAREMIEWSREKAGPKLSLDVPSGIDSTTGLASGIHAVADRTLTLALPKIGLDIPDVGDLWLADIGITAEVYRRAGIEVPAEVFGSEYVVGIRPLVADLPL